MIKFKDAYTGEDLYINERATVITLGVFILTNTEGNKTNATMINYVGCGVTVEESIEVVAEKLALGGLI